MPSPIAELLLAEDRSGDDLDLFAPFVGTWRFDGTLHAADGGRHDYEGRWDWAFVLGGRAIQDVLHCQDVEHGTTIRVPRGDGTWDVVWITPVHRTVTHLRAEPADGRIVITGAAEGKLLRWSFNDMTQDAFLWHGEESTDDGATFRLVQEMRLRRE